MRDIKLGRLLVLSVSAVPTVDAPGAPGSHESKLEEEEECEIRLGRLWVLSIRLKADDSWSSKHTSHIAIEWQLIPLVALSTQ